MKVVVDASVVAMWVLNEEDSDKALLLRDMYINGEIDLYAPSLLRYELANILWKAVALKKLMKPEDAHHALENLLILLPKIVNLTDKDFKKALKLALQRKITVYDASYVLLKEKIKGIFITADKKLYRKIMDAGGVVYLRNFNP